MIGFQQVSRFQFGPFINLDCQLNFTNKICNKQNFEKFYRVFGKKEFCTLYLIESRKYIYLKTGCIPPHHIQFQLQFR